MMHEAVLLRWYKDEGASVSADEAICELETGDASADLLAPYAGVLRRLMREGDTVRKGDEVAKIDTSSNSD